MQLDPSESINNMGNLRVDILDGSDLPAADRNGKSDPYCKFELNGQEVHKTKVQKKTLSPVWNEFFEVVVPSRTAAKFSVDVFDYDFADKPDFLGGAEINLDSLDPFRASESSYLLDGKSGSIRLRMVFRPDYITRARQGTSTFQGTFGGPGRIVTGVAGAPIKGGVAVAGAVGHGVGKGASFLRRGLFGKKDNEDDANGSLPDVVEVPTITTNGDDGPISTGNGSLRRTTGLTDGAVPAKDHHSHHPSLTPEFSGHSRTKSLGGSSVHSTYGPGGAPTGTAVFTVAGASGYSASTDLYIIITQITPKEKVVGKTKHFKSSTGQWNYDESFKFACSPDAQFKVEARGEHRFGSDDGLGEHIYVVDESGMAAPKELNVGMGTVIIKSTFQPTEQSLPDSPKSTLRRSFLSKREGRSRETTPNP